MDKSLLVHQSVELLTKLISMPSFSKEEGGTATIIEQFLARQNIGSERHLNNVWALNQHFDPSKPTLLLNSHHDTVRPNAGYTLDPFAPRIRDEKLYGLGSNDAGGALVSLAAGFLFFARTSGLKYNIVFAATAEEEISGANGIESLLRLLPTPDAAIVGEPTGMKMAVAERGLMVIDAVAHGKAGHAARNEGSNAIEMAFSDIDWINNYRFTKDSELLGPVKMTVTTIETPNKAHNVIPDTCNFTIDVRINELYTHAEVFAILTEHLQSTITMRSDRLKSTSIAEDHPLIVAGRALGLEAYGSPTSSDKALLTCPALKIGPGDSARSHTADEYIFINEIENGIDIYIELLKKVLL